MDYKLTSANGEVKYITSAGSDFVMSFMPEGQVKGIIETAEKVEKSDKFSGFEIFADGKYFCGKFTTAKTEKTTAKKK